MAQSLYEMVGLSISYEDPIMSLRKIGAGNIRNELVDYSHTKTADWGDVEAQINIVVSEAKAQDWYFNGLGRDIKVYSPGGTIIFRGFVDTIDFQTGSITGTLGPLTEVGNRVLAVYTEKLILDDFISDTGQNETIYAEDTDSQGLYGIWEKIIQAGECYVEPDTGYNEAEQARDLFLEKNKTPKSVNQLAPNAEDVGLTLYVRGYVDFLKAFYYQNRIYDDTTITSVTIDALIKLVLADNPNSGILSTNQVYIESNPSLTVAEWKNYETAYSIIEGLNKIGDNGTQYRFYLDSDLLPHYEAVPDTVDYMFSIVTGRQTVRELVSRNEVMPWSVQPGKYISYVDWLYTIAEPPPIVLDTNDIRIRLIQQVNYTAPWSLNITNGDLNLLKSLLNKKAGGNY